MEPLQRVSVHRLQSHRDLELRRSAVNLLDLTLPSPAENLALDEALLLDAEAGGGEVLRLWELPTLAVVLGSGGVLADDVRVSACAADGVPVLDGAVSPPRAHDPPDHDGAAVLVLGASPPVALEDSSAPVAVDDASAPVAVVLALVAVAVA